MLNRLLESIFRLPLYDFYRRKKMRCVGTVVRGIRTPIIKEDDDLATIVVDSLMAAKESE